MRQSPTSLPRARPTTPVVVLHYGFYLLPAHRDVSDAQLAPSFSMLVGIGKTF